MGMDYAVFLCLHYANLNFIFHFLSYEILVYIHVPHKTVEKIHHFDFCVLKNQPLLLAKGMYIFMLFFFIFIIWWYILLALFEMHAENSHMILIRQISVWNVPRFPELSLTGQGWGLLNQFPPFRYFPNFWGSWKHTLGMEYHVYIRQVSPQLSCGDTCQIWMWFKESSRYFCKIENFACEEINERSFSNPHPRSSLSPPWWFTRFFFSQVIGSHVIGGDASAVYHSSVLRALGDLHQTIDAYQGSVVPRYFNHECKSSIVINHCKRSKIVWDTTASATIENVIEHFNCMS